MTTDRVIIKVDSEEVYFQQQQQEQIKALRESAQQSKTDQYCEDHNHHCFRCGTQSLVEVQKGNIIIDVCVNEDCGAVHLDPGELEAILDDKNLISNIRKSIASVFK